jgi:hypothetical protein
VRASDNGRANQEQKSKSTRNHETDRVRIKYSVNNMC